MAEGVKFSYELTNEGIRKMNTLRNLTKASKRNFTTWMAETVKDAKRSAADMKKGSTAGTYMTNKARGHKSGQLGRNIGMEVNQDGDGWVGVVGTGVGKTQTVKYAKIQDEGGITHPKVTDKMRKFAWAMFYATNTKRSKAIGSYMWLYLALTKKSTLTVTIPKSEWFTGVIERRKARLAYLMDPDQVLKTAEQMTGTYTPNEWR
jgi:hypothetical protein